MNIRHERKRETVAIYIYYIFHITPILASLHWLPVCLIIYFKTLFIIFKALVGPALNYLSELLTPYEPAHNFHILGLGCPARCKVAAKKIKR